MFIAFHKSPAAEVEAQGSKEYDWFYPYCKILDMSLGKVSSSDVAEEEEMPEEEMSTGQKLFFNIPKGR